MFFIFCFSFFIFYFLFCFLVFSLVFPSVREINRGDAEESLNYGVEWHGVVGGILEITIAAAGFMGHFCLAHNRCYSFVTFARCTKCRRPRVTHKTHHRLLGTLPNAGTREFCSLLMMAMWTGMWWGPALLTSVHSQTNVFFLYPQCGHRAA